MAQRSPRLPAASERARRRLADGLRPAGPPFLTLARRAAGSRVFVLSAHYRGAALYLLSTSSHGCHRPRRSRDAVSRELAKLKVPARERRSARGRTSDPVAREVRREVVRAAPLVARTATGAASLRARHRLARARARLPRAPRTPRLCFASSPRRVDEGPRRKCSHAVPARAASAHRVRERPRRSLEAPAPRARRFAPRFAARRRQRRFSARPRPRADAALSDTALEGPRRSNARARAARPRRCRSAGAARSSWRSLARLPLRRRPSRSSRAPRRAPARTSRRF